MKKQIDHFTLMVHEQYEYIESNEQEEFSNVRFSATVSIETLSMLDALSQHFFKSSRSAVTRDIIWNGVSRIFEELKEEDQKALAVTADRHIDEHYDEQFTDYHRHGLGHWEAQIKKGGDQ